MTEFEFAELWAFRSQEFSNNFVALSTAIFAYLALGHLAARNLPRSIAVGATIVYSLFLSGPSTSYFSGFVKILTISAQYHQAYPGGWVLANLGTWTWEYTIVLGPVVFAWLGSIYYVYFYVRSKDRQ